MVLLWGMLTSHFIQLWSLMSLRLLFHDLRLGQTSISERNQQNGTLGRQMSPKWSADIGRPTNPETMTVQTLFELSKRRYWYVDLHADMQSLLPEE